MFIYKRPKTRYTNKKGHVVFESPEEARKNGVDSIHTWLPLQVGMWFQYGDGKVAQILKISATDTKILYETILNRFYYQIKTKQLHGAKYGVFLQRPAVFQEAIDLNEITPQHLEFATNWLFNNMSIEEAVEHTYSKVMPQILTLIAHRADIGYRSVYSDRKLFGYIILSGHWFDKLIKTNRVFRDRYMSLVNALEQSGITLEYFGKRLKEHMDSENPKASVPALKMAQEIFEAEQIRQDKLKNPQGGKTAIPSDGMYEMLEEKGKPRVLETHQAGIERMILPPMDDKSAQPIVIKDDAELKKLLEGEGTLK